MPVYANFATGLVSGGVTTSATLIVPQVAYPRTVTIVNHTGTDVIYLGGSGVTTTGAAGLGNIQWDSVTLETSAAIYGIVPTTTQTVGWWSTY